jgi:hypothetical protein
MQVWWRGDGQTLCRLVRRPLQPVVRWRQLGQGGRGEVIFALEEARPLVDVVAALGGEGFFEWGCSRTAAEQLQQPVARISLCVGLLRIQRCRHLRRRHAAGHELTDFLHFFVRVVDVEERCRVA